MVVLPTLDVMVTVWALATVTSVTPVTENADANRGHSMLCSDLEPQARPDRWFFLLIITLPTTASMTTRMSISGPIRRFCINSIDFVHISPEVHWHSQPSVRNELSVEAGSLQNRDVIAVSSK
jgi:hypothetical protein